MPLRPLDVIWIFDEIISPPGDKMVVCVEPTLGFFFRINSRANYQIPVPLLKVPHHGWLHHDSYLEAGQPMELDDYIIDQSLADRGVIGSVHPSVVPQIVEAMNRSKIISDVDKAAVCAALGAN